MSRPRRTPNTDVFGNQMRRGPAIPTVYGTPKAPPPDFALSVLVSLEWLKKIAEDVKRFNEQTLTAQNMTPNAVRYVLALEKLRDATTAGYEECKAKLLSLRSGAFPSYRAWDHGQATGVTVEFEEAEVRTPDWKQAALDYARLLHETEQRENQKDTLLREAFNIIRADRRPRMDEADKWLKSYSDQTHGKKPFAKEFDAKATEQSIIDSTSPTKQVIVEILEFPNPDPVRAIEEFKA